MGEVFNIVLTEEICVQGTLWGKCLTVFSLKRFVFFGISALQSSLVLIVRKGQYS
jgi:hypothetical protein